MYSHIIIYICMCKVARKYLCICLCIKAQNEFVHMYVCPPIVACAPWRMCTLPFNLHCCVQYITHTPCIANAMYGLDMHCWIITLLIVLLSRFYAAIVHLLEILCNHSGSYRSCAYIYIAFRSFLH